MDGARASKTPPLLIAVPRQSAEVLPAPLEGASKTLQQIGSGFCGDGGSSRQNPLERSPLPISALSPLPQPIDSSIGNSKSCRGGGRSQETVSTGCRRSSERPSSLIGIGPESPTFISSPTGLLTISTGLSPTKGPRESLASAASGSPGPVGYYPSSDFSQPPLMGPTHAASGDISFQPHSNIFRPYPPENPLYMTIRPAAGVAAPYGYGSHPIASTPDTTTGLPQWQIKTEDRVDGVGGCYEYGEAGSKGADSGGVSLASLDSSSFFAITPPPRLATTTGNQADLSHHELENMLLRRSPVPADGGSCDAQSGEQQRQEFAGVANFGFARKIDTCGGRLIDGRGCGGLPAVVGSVRGGLGGAYHGSSDDSSSVGGARGSGGDGDVGGVGVNLGPGGDDSAEEGGDAAPPKDHTARPATLRTACNECTTRKIKCDGVHPCLSCRRKGVTCVFSLSQKKVKLVKPTKTGEIVTTPPEDRVVTTLHPTSNGGTAGGGATAAPTEGSRPSYGLPALAACRGAPPPRGRGGKGGRGGGARGVRGRGGRGVRGRGPGRGGRYIGVCGGRDAGRGMCGIGGLAAPIDVGGASSSRGGGAPSPRGVASEGGCATTTPASIANRAASSSQSSPSLGANSTIPSSSRSSSPSSLHGVLSSRGGVLHARGASRGVSRGAARGIARGASRGAATGGLRGRGRGSRGGRGRGRARGGAAAAAAAATAASAALATPATTAVAALPLEGGSALAGVNTQSSVRGQKRSSNVNWGCGGGADGEDDGLREKRGRIVDEEQQERGGLYTPLAEEHGRLLFRPEQAGQQQVALVAAGPRDQGREGGGRGGVGGDVDSDKGHARFLQSRQPQSTLSYHEVTTNGLAVATAPSQTNSRMNSGDEDMVRQDQGTHDKGENDVRDEEGTDPCIEGDLLQHQIRDGTLFGIGHLGGIGALDRYGLTTPDGPPPAAATATAEAAFVGASTAGSPVAGGEIGGRGGGQTREMERAREDSESIRFLRDGSLEEGGGGDGDGDGDDHGNGGGSSDDGEGGEDGMGSSAGYDGEGGPEMIAGCGEDYSDDMIEPPGEGQDTEDEDDDGDLDEDQEGGEDDDDDEDDFLTRVEGQGIGSGGGGGSGAGGSSGSNSSNIGRPRRPTRKKTTKPVWSQLRKACDRCTSKKVKCDGKQGCYQCSRVGATCHFSICRRSGPRDSNGHKTGTLGPIIPRDGYEKVTGRRGSCRVQSPCQFASVDGQSKTEHYHCRTPGCEYASKTMEQLMEHRQEHHPEPAKARRPAGATAAASQKQQLKRKPPQQQQAAEGSGALMYHHQPQANYQKKSKLTPSSSTPHAAISSAPAIQPPLLSLSSPSPPPPASALRQHEAAAPPSLLVVQRYSDFS